MITTSTGAKKLESSDNWREIFPNPGTSAAGAHNASVDAHDRIQAEVAPIINGKRCSVGAASGEYVLLRNSTISGKTDGAYVAAKAIPANTDLDSTYLGNAITGGITNDLNGKLIQDLTWKYHAYKVKGSAITFPQNYREAIFKVYTEDSQAQYGFTIAFNPAVSPGYTLYLYFGNGEKKGHIRIPGDNTVILDSYKENGSEVSAYIAMYYR